MSPCTLSSKCAQRTLLHQAASDVADCSDVNVFLPVVSVALLVCRFQSLSPIFFYLNSETTILRASKWLEQSAYAPDYSRHESENEDGGGGQS